MEILYFDKLDSTHKYLLRKIKAKELFPPVLISADMQTSSIGTRGREWISLKGNLFISMALYKKNLPKDLPLQSISIYYAFLLKEILRQKGSALWLKWPNDFYLKDKKIGGVLTAILKDIVVVSIGLNIIKSPLNFDCLDIKVDKKELIQEFILKQKEVLSWKNIFSKYQVEFFKSKDFRSTFFDGSKVSLKDAILNDDGSLTLNNKRMYCKNG